MDVETESFFTFRFMLCSITANHCQRSSKFEHTDASKILKILLKDINYQHTCQIHSNYSLKEEGFEKDGDVRNTNQQ